MEWFLKYQVIIVRILGIIMLLIGFALYFWGTPKQNLTQNELAAINLARMEAKVSSTAMTKAKPDISSISKHTYSASKKQQYYLIILVMIFGALFIGYSFINNKE